jgi:hypothetical protein
VSVVYSTRFILNNLATGATDSYTVPAGFVAVIVCISVGLSGATEGHCNVGIANGAGVFVFAEVLSAASAGSGELNWVGRQVVYAGEDIAVQAVSACTIAVSGYLLAA